MWGCLNIVMMKWEFEIEEWYILDYLVFERTFWRNFWLLR